MENSAHTFALRITLGNEAMRTWSDLARALRKLASTIDESHDDAPEFGDGNAIMDDNGNRVGRWETE